MAVAGGGRKPNSPPETEFSKAPPKKPRNHFSTMEELAQSAREVLNTMENDGRGEIYIINFVKSVEQYALNSLKGDKPQVQVMEKVQQALNRLDQRMDSIEKATTAIKATATTPLLGTAPEMGTRDRLRPPPISPTSNGSSSIGVSPAELREDREIIVKIRDSDTRETLRRRTPREIVEQAERTREQAARRKASAPLGGGCHFLAAKVLPSGDEADMGVVARGIDTKTMLLTQESMAGMAKELVRQNSHSWGDTQVEILHLGWLVKPGKRREGSIIIEFTDPVVANQAITQGLWQHQVHQTTASAEKACGHCAKQHPTWECAKQGDVEVKCANCGGGHRPTSDACEVRTAAKEGARLALANSPLFHRVPLHFRQRETTKGSTTTSQSQQGLDTPIHAPQQTAQRTTIYRAAPTSNRTVIASHPTENAPHPTENASHPTKEIRRMYTKVGVEKPQRRKEPSHVMRTRSRTSEDDDLPIIPEELAETASAVSQSARSLRSQNQETMQFMTDPEKQLQTSYKKQHQLMIWRRTTLWMNNPERLGDTNWYDTKLLKSTKMRKRSSMMRRSTVMIQEQTPTTPPHLNELLPNNSIQCTQRPSSHGLISVRQSSPESGCDCGSGTLDQLSINNNPLPKQGHHQLVFPKELEGERARVCLFVSKRIDPGSWSCKTVSKGYQLLKLRRNHLDGWTDLFMHNIYNNDDGETVEKLNRELAQRPYAEHILIGDMNLHHPTWSGIGSKAKATAAAERLLDIAGIHNLSLTTETGSPTWRRNEQASVLDLTFVSNTLAERVVECQVGTDHGSDHYPVVTTIDIGTPPYEPPKRRNWKATDDKKLIEFIERQLTNTTTNTNNTTPPIPPPTPKTSQQPTIRYLYTMGDPFAVGKSSFTPECQEAVKEVRQLRRRHERTGDPYDKELYKAARNRKTRLIKIALRRYHRRKVQEVIEGPGGMWRMSKWARNRQGAYDQGVTPSIKIPGGLAETVEEKAAAFQQAFFPVPPPADLSDIDSKVINHDPTEINRGPIRFPEITHQEIKQAVKASPPDKAPGEDGLPNSLWHKLIEIPTVLDTISRIYNACIRLGTNPTHFQKSITVVLRKAGKRDYQLAKSYRPVALLNTLGKFLEAVVARRISYAVETYKLLPDTHFGGRKGISVDHAIQSIIGRIRRAWGKGKIASMLLLDVSGAYDNVSHERLLYNLRKRGLGQLAPWVKAFLTSRSTRIRIPEGVSESIPTPTGIPQGSPLSPILYLIYNADLVEGCEGVKTSGWVDDVAFIVIGKDEHETISKLQKACQYADAWAARHASVFDPKKYALIHFGTTVQATTTAERYLGVWLDPGLTFQHHRQQMLAKAGVSLQALRGLTGSTWGASLSAMRAIYQAVMIPQMLFGAAAWHSPLTSTLRERSYVKQFANIQSRAACLMSGAFKTTAREALDIELHLLPMQQQLDRLVQLAAIRIRTGPAYAVPKTMLVERGHMQKQRGVYTDGGPNLEEGWLPHYTLGAIGEYLGEQEGIHPGTMDQATKARLYTDGSGYQGGIGAAVYPAYPYRRNEARLCNMGTDDDATVYAAELRAIEMALEVIKERFNDDNEWRDCLAKSGVVIFTDNQATLRAIQNPRMPSGQVYLEGCLRLLEWCNDKIQVELRWVPAHEGIPGNEAADMYAKEAATTTETNIHDTNANATNANTNDNTNVNTNVNHNRSIRLAAAASKSVKRESTIAWEKAWTKGGSKRTARRTRRMIEVPSKSNLTYWKGLRKATTSVLIQLRTGIIGLAEYLSKIKRSDSPRCQCDLGNQSVKHVLLECPLLKELRSEMVEELFMEGVDNAWRTSNVDRSEGSADRGEVHDRIGTLGTVSVSGLGRHG
ncbi:hypothetical protein PDIDSM_6304 [Penicillium digitatum]|nr:hypothetical protein PDIDSM_6304 [Penicillium digitatum]